MIERLKVVEKKHAVKESIYGTCGSADRVRPMSRNAACRIPSRQYPATEVQTRDHVDEMNAKTYATL